MIFCLAMDLRFRYRTVGIIFQTFFVQPYVELFVVDLFVSDVVESVDGG